MSGEATGIGFLFLWYCVLSHDLLGDHIDRFMSVDPTWLKKVMAHLVHLGLTQPLMSGFKVASVVRLNRVSCLLLDMRGIYFLALGVQASSSRSLSYCLTGLPRTPVRLVLFRRCASYIAVSHREVP